MKLYIDKGNLKNIFLETDHPLQRDAIKTMKLQLDLKFNFSRVEALADEVLSMGMLGFLEGVGEGVLHEYEEDGYTPFVVKSNIHTTHPNKQSSFLLERPENKISECKKNGGLLINGLGEEFELFEKLFLFRGDGGFHQGLKIGSTKLNSWPSLYSYALPFTDLILVDNYIINDPSIVSSNLLDLLKSLHHKKSIETNIIIFTDKDKVRVNTEDLRKQIIEAVKEITGRRSKVTIVLWKDLKDRKHDNYASQYSEHDRTILLNYIRFKSGDSFNYFDSNGKKLTKGRELDIFSLANRDMFILAKETIDDLNKYVVWAKEKNADNIIGDKKSNFLEF